jgi:hypothetical protein
VAALSSLRARHRRALVRLFQTMLAWFAPELMF